MNEFTEVEFKYKADDIGLKSFLDLMNDIGYDKKLTVSSWDYYYTKGFDDDFLRFRDSPESPELTIKRKTKDANNWVRIEVDLPLNPKLSEEALQNTVQQFVALEGYEENFRVYKSCFIFWQEHVNYVYYIVYDEQMREQGRFVEVEVNKGFDFSNLSFFDETSQEAIPFTPELAIKQAEDRLNVLGITKRNRMKKSLFELYRRKG